MKKNFEQRENKGEWMKSQKCKSNDLDQFNEKLIRIAIDREFVFEELGIIYDDPILLLSPKQLINAPNILIAAGFHGDEPAGSWGILNYLESIPPLSNVNISFLPIVNPSGFRNARRTNTGGEDPNRGFAHTPTGKPQPSSEGSILLTHLERLKFLAKDIFVSLHEDWEQNFFYLYTFENGEVPGIFSYTLHAAQVKFFDQHPDGILEGASVKDGIIFRFCDGAFEDFLFHEGIPRTACTETPGKQSITKRIEANTNIIKEVVNFAYTL